MDWIKSHWAEIGVIVLYLHTFLKAIARITATKKDDMIMDKIGSVIAYLFGKDPK